MAISLRANTLALCKGNSTSFQGYGGVAPYVYSVVAGGAGGTINASTGKYTAPLVLGSDTIMVTDSTNATATLALMIGDPILLLCDIIRREMNLSNEQVWIWDQKINSPKDYRLYVAVQTLNDKAFGNTNSFDSAGNSIQSVNMWEQVSIDIMSRDQSARTRKEEVLMALASNYAQTQQTTNGFYIAKQSTSFVNLSQVDGAAITYRFNITVTLQYAVKKSQAVPYYDSFSNVQITVEP